MGYSSLLGRYSKGNYFFGFMILRFKRWNGGIIREGFREKVGGKGSYLLVVVIVG